MIHTTVGYAGGHAADPTYRHLGDHSETVQVEFDPGKIGYEQLLEVFWESHDPTAKPWLLQYRNAVFYTSERQRQLAEASRQAQEKKIGGPVATAIEPAGRFYPAEDYHQKYLLRRAERIFLAFREIYPEEAGLTASTAAARVNGYLGCYGDPGTLTERVETLGLPTELGSMLREYVELNCGGVQGLTCPAPPRPAR